MDLTEIINNYNTLSGGKSKNESLELEIIFKNIDINKFRNIKELLDKESKPEISYMVDKIHSNIADSDKIKHSTSRLTLFYDKTATGYKLNKILKMNKKRFLPFEDTTYKVVLSTEEVFEYESNSKSASSSSNDYCRIKVRNTYMIDKLPNFKIDLTAVFGMKWNTNSQQQNQKCKEIFDANDNLIKFNSFELEAEYINPANKQLTIDDINNTISLMMNFVNKLDNNLMTIELNQIADLVGRSKGHKMTIKKIANNPTELNNNLWQDVFPPLGWYLTDKADGKRAFIFINGKKASFITNDIEILELKTQEKKTIVDCELINDIYYVFDVLYFKDKSFINENFSIRLTELKNAADHISEITNKKVMAKPFIRFPIIVSNDMKTELKKVVEEMYNRKREYEIDGLIFNSPDSGYYDTKMYKWKPINTIDFLAVKCPDKLLNTQYLKLTGKILYLLFSTIYISDLDSLNINLIDNYNLLFPNKPEKSLPVQFSPASYPKAYLWYVDEEKDANFNMKIVELSGDKVNNKIINELIAKNKPFPWELVKVRDDRQVDVDAGNYFGNAFIVAEGIWQNVINPLTLEKLYSPENVYFEQDKDPVYNAPVGFNSYIKSILFKDIKTGANPVLLDIAAGRGADIRRYADSDYLHVVAIDEDINALSELSRRRFAIAKTKKIPMINTTQVNMNDNYQTIIDHFTNIGFPAQYDSISCNFAIHYMKLQNLAKFVGKLLKPLGCFGFTCLNGEKVNDLLKDLKINESWTRKLENGFTKYEIKKHYNGAIFNNGGQIISVKVPFSNELYSESLVSINYFLELLEKEGMRLKSRKSFAEFRGDFSRDNAEMEKRLTDDDMAYNGLYEFVIVEKTIKGRGPRVKKN
jgi:hypothetical protein